MAATTNAGGGLLGDDAEPDAAGDHHAFGGAWTRIKLEALQKYLVAFNTALSKQSFTRIYVDAFAGTGRCDIKVDGQKMIIDGSARLALAADPGVSVRARHLDRQGEPASAARLPAVRQQFLEAAVRQGR